jgi:transcription factor MBP1
MTTQIFKATYSGVPVYEMPCKGVAVMRRRSDSYLNATQILKVAGFDKPQRTRVLEREVQKQTHEKVQGGYGKYQGTWVPLERGIALSQQYGVDHLLQPIFEYVATGDSPPLAPKHVVAAPTRTKRKVETEQASPVPRVTAKAARNGRRETLDSDSDVSRVEADEDSRSLSPTPSNGSSPSRTPSPLASSLSASEFDPSMPQAGNKRRRTTGDTLAEDAYNHRTNGQALGAAAPLAPNQGAAKYARLILDYFVSDSTQVPQFLISPPADFDANVVIDDDGHTALHWACAMGRILVVKLLLSAGADIFRSNNEGQTALMRSVMFTNNYDLRKFPELFELLQRSTINIDRHDRTLFHYIVDIALRKGKAHAARYYMETVLGRLQDYPNEVTEILNFQDDEGETALTLAARARSKRMVKLLMDHGADPRIRNSDGKSTEDYILEDEHFRSSSVGPTGYGPAGVTGLYPSQLHYSETGQRASAAVIPQMAELLESLATTFDNELEDKERNLAQAHALLGNIQTEILDSQRAVAALKDQAAALDEIRAREASLNVELKEKMGKRFRLGWEKYVRDEDDRERSARSGGGLLPPDIESLSLLPPMPMSEAMADLRVEIGELRHNRRDWFDDFAQLQAQTGTGTKMGELRKLVAMGCGLPLTEIDATVPALIDALEHEIPQPNMWVPIAV